MIQLVHFAQNVPMTNYITEWITQYVCKHRLLFVNKYYTVKDIPKHVY